MIHLKGYKVFDKGLKNRYGMTFLEGEVYSVDTTLRNISFGNNGYGFHFVKRLEDGLRYFDGMNDDIDIALVESIGSLVEYYDDYNGYYDMFVTDKIYIDHLLSREEIIDYILNVNIDRVERFVQGYKLSDDEIDLLLARYNSCELSRAIDYYQKNDKDVYSKKVRVYSNL